MSLMMAELIKTGKKQSNIDRYLDLIHQITDGKNENDVGYNKLVLETCHTAKFICQLDNNIEIVKKSEIPDFIIKFQDRIIGLEHEILVKQESKQKEGSIEDLVKGVEKEYRKNHPDKKLLLTIYPNPQLKFRKVDKPQISKKILIIVEDFINYNIFPENDYVYRLKIGPHSQLTFSCNLGA